MLYRVVLVSAMYLRESAIGIYVSLPSRTSLPPPTPSHSSAWSVLFLILSRRKKLQFNSEKLVENKSAPERVIGNWRKKSFSP